jgi:hypothetical protein
MFLPILFLRSGLVRRAGNPAMNFPHTLFMGKMEIRMIAGCRCIPCRTAVLTWSSVPRYLMRKPLRLKPLEKAKKIL